MMPAVLRWTQRCSRRAEIERRVFYGGLVRRLSRWSRCVVCCSSSSSVRFAVGGRLGPADVYALRDESAVQLGNRQSGVRQNVLCSVCFPSRTVRDD
jgi:hypothetical protein